MAALVAEVLAAGFAEQLELPPGFQFLNHVEHLGEMGKIGGRPMVPADWDSCAFESMEQRVLVDTYARFRAYNRVLADDACGPRSCEDEDLVIWIE